MVHRWTLTASICEMTRQQPETILVAAIRKDIQDRYRGCLILKIHGGPFQIAGIPDLLVFYAGRTVALEVKCQRPGEGREHARGRVTAVQRKMISDFRKVGITADCVTSAAEALAVIQGREPFFDTEKKDAEVIDINKYRESE